jgi:capsular polysaccharide transport system permease protein
MSKNRMGLFLTFFEPLYQVAFFVLIKVLIFGRGDGSTDYVVFLGIVFLPFFMTRNIIQKAVGAFSANRSLFVYRQVKPIDTIFARTLLELFLYGIIFLIAVIIAFYFEFDTNPQSFATMIFAYIWLILFAFSLGIFLAVFNSYSNIIQSIVKMLFMGLIFLSALFYSVESLAPEVRELILYNPLAHFMEMIHGAYFYTLDDRYVDYFYMTMWTLIPFTVGLWWYLRAEKRIISQ